MGRQSVLGLLAALAASAALLSLPSPALGCAPAPPPSDVQGAPASTVNTPPIEFLGQLTSLRPVPPEGAFRPLTPESTASFTVLRVFRGHVGTSITLSTQASGLKVGEVYTVPVYGDFAGMECGPQVQPGNPTRLIGYTPVSSFGRRTLGAVTLAVGVFLGAALALRRWQGGRAQKARS